MTEISDSDWTALEALANRVGYPAERIGSVRRRLQTPLERRGAPYVLLAGRPDAGIELLLARWLMPEVAELLLKAGDQPLVIGPQPGDVRPCLGVWSGCKSMKVPVGHWIALRSDGPVAAATLAQLQSLGFADLFVLVTRLSQPLHQKERELARCCAMAAATARVLVVGLPGEEPTEADVAEVTAYAATQMRQAGFRDGRCLGTGVWFTGGEPPSGVLRDLNAFLTPDATAVGAGRNGMRRQTLVKVFCELEQKARQSTTPPAAAIPDDERIRLTRELASYLADLGKEVQRQVEKSTVKSAEEIRTYVLNALRGWSAYSTIEGHWMKYVERLRPGVQATFFAEAQSTLSLVEYEPGREAPPVPTPVDTALAGRVGVEAKRLAVGLAVGLTAYLTVTALLHARPDDPTALPALVISILSYASLVLAAVLGYGLGRMFFRLPIPQSLPIAEPPQPAKVRGWVQVERNLGAWFSEQVATQPVSPLEEYQEVARRLGFEEILS